MVGRVVFLEHLVNIELFGQAYTFKSDAEASTAKQVADLLVQEVEQVQRHSDPTSNIPKLTLLILAALNLSNRMVQMQCEFGECIAKVAERSDRLNRMLDEGLRNTQPLRVSV
jgi:cell division protein ZapA (FtsZ GTPase activity inhibitor)